MGFAKRQQVRGDFAFDIWACVEVFRQLSESMIIVLVFW